TCDPWPRRSRFFPHLFKQTLDHQCLTEVFQVWEIGRPTVECGPRDQSNYFSAHNLNVTARGRVANRGEGHRHSGPFVINQVHRNLHETTTMQLESERFDERQASVTFANFM